MSQELLVMVGLQGSGKSSYCRLHLGADYIYVSKDQFPNNRRPQRRQMQLVEAAMTQGRSVVVDNTHPSVEQRRPLLDLGLRYSIPVRAIFLATPLEVCLQRNDARPEPQRVPRVGIYANRKLFQPPTLEEGFAQVVVIYHEI